MVELKFSLSKRLECPSYLNSGASFIFLIKRSLYHSLTISSRVLWLDDIWRTFDMTDITKEDQGYSQIKEPSLLDDNVPLYYNFSRCLEK